MNFKSVSFNIFEENLEDIVYKNRNEQNTRSNEPEKQDKFSKTDDLPVPKPINEYWKAPLSHTRKN